jgi:hypothetical protein
MLATMPKAEVSLITFEKDLKILIADEREWLNSAANKFVVPTNVGKYMVSLD